MMTFDRNIPYNSLPAIPPIGAVEEKPEILMALVKAARALAKVDGQIKRLPNPAMLINTVALQEAKSSTEIENIFTTDDELYRAISSTKKLPKINPATKEVLRYREALWAGYNHLRKDRIIDTDLIIEIFQAIKKTKESIRPPHTLLTIKRGQSEFRPGEVVYTPPRGAGILEPMLENLIEYLNTEDHVDPIIKMAVAHYQFESIHPFRDGNGRTGRIINLLYLVQKGLLTAPNIYLSKQIIATKDEYYYQLGAVRQNQDFTNWILYMLSVVEKTANNTYTLVESILNQMESTLAYGKSTFKWYNKEINEVIFTQPYSKSEHLAPYFGRSRTTVKKYMDHLVVAKILRATQNWKESYYVNDELLTILEQ